MPFRTLVAVYISVSALGLGLGLSGAGTHTGPTHAAAAGSGALFLISGHGYGHGVGMGQWGAEGAALQGDTYDEILAHYYPGTTLSTTSVGSIRVLLAEHRKSLTISSSQPISVEGADGHAHTLPAGKTKLTTALDLAVDGGAPQALEPPLTFSPASGATLTLGRAYRGQILVDVVDGKLRAIDVVPLEQYLYGVVPAEMPSSWLPAALEAQAVAARSYALASSRAGAPFDVYSDTRSQAYLGVSAETPEGTEAVDETAGQVLVFGGHVADTVFSSSSGGTTQSAADAWGGQGDPYLVSVPDPYDSISPYHDWGPVAVTAKSLAKKLGISGGIVDASVTRNSSQRVADVELTSVAHGQESTRSVTGPSVAAALGLRSTWFDIGVLSLEPPAPNPPIPYGGSTTLTGVVRGVTSVVLQQRSTGKSWTEARAVAPAANTGTIAIRVEPQLTTQYRLATASNAAAAVRIRVAPAVSLAQASRSGVSGSERPVLSGATVLVEQQQTAGSQRWTVVARGSVGDDGSFSVSTALQPGPTRVVVAAGNGWSPGASSSATVA